MIRSGFILQQANGTLEIARLPIAVAIWLLVLLSAAELAVAGEEQTPVAGWPNIVLMMADDLGWGDLRCFNAASPIRTPHLNAMAAAGMKFSHFYAAAPVCSPTRGSCLTGRHPFRYGIYSANVGHLPAGEVTLAELLRERGYATGHFGKWHLGTLTRSVPDSNRGGPKGAAHYAPPWEHGFEVCFSTEAKVPTWDPMQKPMKGATSRGWVAMEDLRQAASYGTSYWTARGERVTDNLAGDDSRVMMDRVLPFVQQAAAESTPFFAVVWFHAPHLPVVAGPKFAEMYDGHDSYHRNYYGCVTALDEQVGRLRKALREVGIEEDTMLWFCSDNGPEGSAMAPGSAGGLRGRKRSLLEGGVRVPGILEWPRMVEAGSETDFPVVTSDYLPTILDALNIEMPDARPLDGISLLPVLTGQMMTRTEPIGFRSSKQRALAWQRFKIYSNDGGANWQLYNLQSDPAETTDLSGRLPEQTARLVKQFEAWQRSCEESDQGLDY